jgi:hypothetical protein
MRNLSREEAAHRPYGCPAFGLFEREARILSTDSVTESCSLAGVAIIPAVQALLVGCARHPKK